VSPEELSDAVAPVVERMLTPALVIDLDAADHNIGAVLRRCGDPARWRPHIKTLKQRVLVEALLRAGVSTFKCATLDELQLLLETADAGRVPIDALLAFPLWSAALDAALRLRAAHPTARVQLLADSPAHARAIADRAAGRAPIEIHLDVDLGMARTGTPPELWAQALDLGSLAQLPTLQIAGLHGYDGHHRSDARAAAFEGYDRLCELAQRVRRAPLDLVTSGTHSYAHALAHPRLSSGPWRHQISPGTVVLCDLRSHEAARDLDLRQAAFVASRVVHVAPGRATLDAGSKAVTPDGAPPTSAVLGRPGLVPQRASEEHLPLRMAAGETLRPGELLWLVPDHVCTTVNLHRATIWLRNGRYCGHGPIEAAGHSLWARVPEPP
jgi:D-serine deaminase-like pyridoxal phosphate-dependent protein